MPWAYPVSQLGLFTRGQFKALRQVFDGHGLWHMVDNVECQRARLVVTDMELHLIPAAKCQIAGQAAAYLGRGDALQAQCIDCRRDQQRQQQAPAEGLPKRGQIDAQRLNAADDNAQHQHRCEHPEQCARRLHA